MSNPNKVKKTNLRDQEYIGPGVENTFQDVTFWEEWLHLAYNPRKFKGNFHQAAMMLNWLGEGIFDRFYGHENKDAPQIAPPRILIARSSRVYNGAFAYSYEFDAVIVSKEVLEQLSLTDLQAFYAPAYFGTPEILMKLVGYEEADHAFYDATHPHDTPILKTDDPNYHAQDHELQALNNVLDYAIEKEFPTETIEDIKEKIHNAVQAAKNLNS